MQENQTVKVISALPANLDGTPAVNLKKLSSKLNFWVVWGLGTTSTVATAFSLVGKFGKPVSVEPLPVGVTPEVPEITSEPKMASSVTNEQDFNDAFKSARQECGSNGYFVWHGKVYDTMHDDELKLLSSDERKEMSNHVMDSFYKTHTEADLAYTDSSTNSSVESPQNTTASNYAFVLYDEAPIANVNDEMTFNEAFKAARNEVGPGGCFKWHGEMHSTYTHEEWSGASESQLANFRESVLEEVIPSSKPLETETPVEIIANVSKEYDIDLGDGKIAHCKDVIVDGKLEIQFDINKDGTYDMIGKPSHEGGYDFYTMDGKHIEHVNNADIAQEQDNPDFDPSTPIIDPLHVNEIINHETFDNNTGQDDFAL
jgi:hypothetical protein